MQNRSSSFLVLTITLVYTGIILGGARYFPDWGRTPDSYGYLESALALANGEGYTWHGSWNAFWPIGYSACIAVVYKLLPVSILWASKIVNVLALYALVFFLHRQYREKAFLLVLAMGYLLKMAIYSWSETLFISLMIWSSFSLYRWLNATSASGRSSLTFSLVWLSYTSFLVRYLGGILSIALGILSVYYFGTGKPTQALRCLRVTLLLLAGYAGYFLLNYWMGGTIWGGPRFVETEPFPALMENIFSGWLNEFVLLRDASLTDPSLWISLVIQLIVIRWVATHYSYLRVNFPSSLAGTYFIVGITYAIIISVLRLVSPFDPLNYRLLAPATVLLVLAALDLLTDPRYDRQWNKVKLPLSIFFIIVSLSNLLPKDLVKLHALFQ